MTEPLRMAFDVDRAVEHVFEVWTEKFARWWPADHTVTGDAEARVVLEPKLGGRIFEETTAGETHQWGEITIWDPPHRLGYLWYLRRDRADATTVEITFVDRGGSTRVEIEHRGWERLGARGPDFRTANRAGWNGLLPHFIAACTTSEEHSRNQGDSDENPLASTAAFARFQEGLDERCAVPPSPSPATLIGHYDGLDPAETPKVQRPHS